MQAIQTILQYVGYGVVFVLMISVLVAAHEYGHYLFARMFNMGVEEFAIGFGKRPIVTWKRKSYILPIKPGDDPDAGHSSATSSDGAAAFAASALEGSAPNRKIERIDTAEGPALRETTDFNIRPWPLGGFVRIKGMMPQEDGSEVRIPGGFYNKAPWQRLLVLLAGPLFSVVAGILILIPVYMVDGKEIAQNVPVIGSVGVERPSGRAGMKPGDKVIAINGQPIDSFYQMVGIVDRSEGKTLRFEVERAGLHRVLLVDPELDKKPAPVLGPDLEITSTLVKTYRIGVSPKVEQVRLSFGAALSDAMKTPGKAVASLLGLFARPDQFSETVSGPATMVSLTARAVGFGIWKVLWLSAMLSISVGIFNLLPAPPLDGGQMAMAIAEMFRGGKRLSIRAQAIASGVGMTLVLALVLGAVVVDFKRFTGPKEDEKPAPAASAPAKK